MKNFKRKIELENQFKEKMNSMFNNYKLKVLNGTKEEIFNKSYETTIKEELTNFLINFVTLLPPNEIEPLYNSDKLLDICYQNWLNLNSNLSEKLDECTFESVGEIIKKEYER